MVLDAITTVGRPHAEAPLRKRSLLQSVPHREMVYDTSQTQRTRDSPFAFRCGIFLANGINLVRFAYPPPEGLGRPRRDDRFI